MNNTIFVGLDVHKETIAVAVAEADAAVRSANLAIFLTAPITSKNWSNGWPRVIVLCHFVTKLGHSAMAFTGS